MYKFETILTMKTKRIIYYPPTAGMSTKKKKANYNQHPKNKKGLILHLDIKEQNDVLLSKY